MNNFTKRRWKFYGRCDLVARWFADGFNYVRFPDEPIAGFDDRWPYEAVKEMLIAANLDKELEILETERKRRGKIKK